MKQISACLFISALVGIVALLLADAVRHYSFSSVHQHVAAFPLLLIGLSYISLQLSTRRRPSEVIKELLLGLAFVLWGGEQLLPSSPLVTILDSLVVTIFVVDLALIIKERLAGVEQDARDNKCPCCQNVIHG